MSQEKIIPVAIANELKESYLNYAMSVIVSRALPDARDGLKPVHRRIMYVMSQMKLDYSVKTRKCAQIVGDVMGKYHPHGDSAIYDTLVRMAQDFSLRYPLVYGQGNFGSIDGDPPAAYRYTEAKMSRLAETMLRDIKKETVDFAPNYDGSMEEPSVLPAALPNLLLNGSSGIAVGMATNMAPHNLREVGAAILATIENPDIAVEGLLKHVKGPDFPTGAIIHGVSGYRQAALTGRGAIITRARAAIEERPGDKEAIIISELPYMVNKKNLLIHIADLVKDKKIEAISDIRDESDAKIRVVIELKRGSQASVVLNQLYQHTALQSTFNINNLALIDGKPRALNLKDMIVSFIAHRKDVTVRRAQFELRELRAREHILQGLRVALQNIDEVVEIIKASPNGATAKERLMARFELSDIQTQAILDMRLQRLTSLETQKILDELAEILKEIARLEDLLAHEDKIYGAIRQETEQIIQTYGDDRRSEIVLDEVEGLDIEDLIEKEDMVALISKRGFIKRVPLSEYKEQGRGGKGSLSVKLGDEDYVSHLFTGSTHDILFFVTTKGRGYWLKVYQIPEASRQGKGRHLKTMFEFAEDEEISETVCFSEFSDNRYLFMATKRGVVKRVKLSAFKNAKTRGIIAIDLDEGDSLQRAETTNGNENIILVSRNGRALRFNESAVRAMGRLSRGVRGIRLKTDDELISLCVEGEGQKLFLLSENGYGKRTEFANFTPHGRGTGGQRAANSNGKFGKLLAAASCDEDKSLLAITASGKTIKTALANIPIMGRTAGGVRIVKVEDGDHVVGIAMALKDVDFSDADQDMSDHEYSQGELFEGSAEDGGAD